MLHRLRIRLAFWLLPIDCAISKVGTVGEIPTTTTTTTPSDTVIYAKADGLWTYDGTSMTRIN